MSKFLMKKKLIYADEMDYDKLIKLLKQREIYVLKT